MSQSNQSENDVPFYRFVCSVCENQERKLMTKAQADKYTAACICGHPMHPVLGSAQGRSMETVDEYRNKKAVSNVKEMLTERAKDHFRKNDVKQIIDEHGMEFAKKNGFVDEDGKAK